MSLTFWLVSIVKGLTTAVSMRNLCSVIALAGITTAALGQSDPVVNLEPVSVYSIQVANQDPVGTFATPVSALKFDPGVDVQARNGAETQADVTIRGGIFENSGFKIGAVSVYDPQTGHYLAEIPVAPAMLTAPKVLTGVADAEQGLNANVGTIAYGWRPITEAGEMSAAGGEYHSDKEEFYQGATHALGDSATLGADVAFAHSASDGSIPYGDHKFYRYNARLQLRSRAGQTDLFAGYQSKFFGWPNLYTPFNVDETEDLQTVFATLNHRVELGGGDFLEAAAYWRRNKDNYEFDRFIPGLYNPYQHTTWVTGAGLSGRSTLGADALVLNFDAQAAMDALESTSLVFGRFRHRDTLKLVLVPEKTWALADGSLLDVKAGATYDDTNKDGSAVSPVFEIARTVRAPGRGETRVYASVTGTSQVATYTALDSSPNSGLFRGNPNLGRTRSDNFELGASTPLGAWSVRGAVFWRDDHNLVDWTYLQGVYARTANAVDVKTAGVELVAYRSWRWVDLNLGYTALTKDANYGSAAVDASFYALNYARQRLTAAVVARLGGGFELRLDNEARIQEPNSLRTSPSDVVLSAVGLSYRPVWLRSLELTAQVDNLWNTNYQEVPSVPSARRAWMLGARYGW
ncbi:vitamin B12 transporter BtuB [mine drainage metagenome]|uniref:Vitamin B12 transporter BtuB n=1 Tax=mine drainage metagenome TaxID=410659 RepID=A0A1J5SJ45_9ZZZZ